MKVEVFSLLGMLFMVCWANGKDSWPHGSYGLPKAKPGCPNDITWEEGWRKQDLDENSQTSSNIHMDVQVKLGGDINRTFCVKTMNNTAHKTWPRGLYCIYKAKDSPCPSGMSEGAVQWDDDSLLNTNQHGGVLPDGVYDSNTKIYYCCQNTGRWFEEIELPTDRPFYLLPHNNSALSVPRCQLVKWTMSWLEYIDYDTIDLRSDDKSYGDHVFYEYIQQSRFAIFSSLLSHEVLRAYYCYYEGCRHNLDKDEGVFGSQNGNPRFHKCSWSIKVEKSRVISIRFTRLQLPKCEESYLAVYDGVDERAPLLQKYCDFGTRRNIVSSGNHVFVILKSLKPKKDFSSQPKFEARYIALESSSGFIPRTRPTNQSLNAKPQSTGGKCGLIIGLVVATIFLVIIVLVGIFRAKLIGCLKRGCCRETRKETGTTGKPTTKETQSKYSKETTPHTQYNGHREPYLDFVQVAERTDEGHYTDLNMTRQEPENIYQSLQVNQRRDPGPENEQNTDYYETMT